MKEEMRNKIIKLREDKLSIRDIAIKLNINRGSVEYELKKLKTDTVIEKDDVIEDIVIKPTVIKETVLKDDVPKKDVPIYTETETVPKGCLEWKRKFTTDRYYPPGTVKHYIAWGTAGIEKEEGLRLLKEWGKTQEDVLPDENKIMTKEPMPDHPDKDIQNTHELTKGGSGWVWIEK